MSKDKRVFVVHGRNKRVRDAMFTFLRTLKLEPLDWTEACNLTNKSSPYILDIIKVGLENSQCAVVLFTGDDIVKIKESYGSESFKLQPRPNVIFEAGMAMMLGGQEKTILVTFKALRGFTDIEGISLTNLDNTATSRKSFVNRLKIAGCNLDERGTDFLNPEAGGNFELEDNIHEYSEILHRGGFTDYIVDSSLSHSINSIALNRELADYLTSGQNIDLKFNYLGNLCASYWLSLSEDPNYGHSKLLKFVSDTSGEIIEACQFNRSSEVDLISLGTGDGIIDKSLIINIQNFAILKNYYPFDLSFELLQQATTEILNTKFIEKNFHIKAIHGDFMELRRYFPIYGFDQSVNFFSLLGFTLGNFIEAHIIGKIKEGMLIGDYLLVDARLHTLDNIKQKLTTEEKEKILNSYTHPSNNKFAFGPVESVTFASNNEVKFEYKVTTEYTVVPNAVNIVTFCTNVTTRFRHNNKPLRKEKINLSVTSLYNFDVLADWLTNKGFQLIWRKKQGEMGLFLLKKIDS